MMSKTNFALQRTLTIASIIFLLLAFGNFNIKRADCAIAATGVSLHWNGVNTVYVELWDDDGQNKLSWWSCGPGKSATQDAAPGDYQVRLVIFGGEPMPGYKPYDIKVLAGQMYTLTPEVGEVTFRWEGLKPDMVNSGT